MKLLKEVEIENLSSDWHAEDYLATLNKIREELEQEKPENPTVLLHNLISATFIYFSIDASEKNTPISESIQDAFGYLNIILKDKAIGKKIKTDNNSMAIGLLVEGLVYFDMPRIAAIEATKDWLDLGQSTVRIHSELYRRRSPAHALKDSPVFEIHFQLSSYKRIIREYINNTPDFPHTHPKAKKAFLSLKNLVSKDPFRRK